MLCVCVCLCSHLFSKSSLLEDASAPPETRLRDTVFPARCGRCKVPTSFFGGQAVRTGDAKYPLRFGGPAASHLDRVYAIASRSASVGEEEGCGSVNSD